MPCSSSASSARRRTAARLFPLSIGSVGSCQLGGLISTNAGGLNVLRYGNTRHLVLGLEVVLPDGRVWDGLRGLRKDNAGYDLKHLFIGAEGTLGVVTAAVIKLVPRPTGTATALLGLETPAAALRWLSVAKARFAEQLTAAELIQRICLETTCAHIPGTRDPLEHAYPWYLLVEVAGQRSDDEIRADLADALEVGFLAGDILDGTVATSRQQEQALWAMREAIPDGHRRAGKSYKHDVSVPLSRIDEFLRNAERDLKAAFPDIVMFTFGHLGDGNLHFNPLHGGTTPPQPGELDRVNRIVHDLVATLGGSISAEHGVGRLRRSELVRYRSETELSMMRLLKTAFDPLGIMNPGKVLTEADERFS